MEHAHESLFADPRLWVGIAFTIFFLIFGKKLVTSVTAMLDRRADAIRADLEGAAQLRREAEIILQDARAQREAARREAESMLSYAREEATRVAESARTDAAAAASRREKMAMDRIGAAEKAAITDVRLAAADVAARAASQVLAQGFGPEADSALIDHAIQGLPAALRAA